MLGTFRWKHISHQQKNCCQKYFAFHVLLIIARQRTSLLKRPSTKSVKKLITEENVKQRMIDYPVTYFTKI